MKPAREPDSPDLAGLAKRFIDLWQEQMTALAGDPALADSIARFMAALPPGMPLWPGFRDAGAGADRTPPAGAAPDERGERVDELASRLATLEQRLARLEAGPRPARAGIRSKPKKRRA